MSRSGYSDDYDNAQLWRQAVRRATTGCWGQHLLTKLRDALDAMPVKRLIADEIQDSRGDVCVLGALDPTVKSYDADDLAVHFKIARALAAEIVYMNDEYVPYPAYEYGKRIHETPEQRWVRMRAWVDSQITPEEPPAADAVDPVAAKQD